MEETNQIEIVLKQRAVDLKSALEKYDPRNSEGEELELAQFYYAIYVPEKDHTVNSHFYNKKASDTLGDQLGDIHRYVEESPHKDDIFNYFLSALEFARALYKDKFPDDDQILHRVDAYQHLSQSYESLCGKLGI